VLEECEHRRRGFDDEAEDGLMRVETEVLETAMPQYIVAAREMTALERSKFGVWRGGDPAARFAFAIGGLLIGSLLLKLRSCRSSRSRSCSHWPEPARSNPSSNATRTSAGISELNRIVTEATRYQENAKLHYRTTKVEE